MADGGGGGGSKYFCCSMSLSCVRFVFVCLYLILK